MSEPVAECAECRTTITEEELARGVCPHCGHPLLEDPDGVEGV